MKDIEKAVSSIEVSQQSVRREGADEMLAYMESLNAEKTAIKKAVDFLNSWHPEDIDKIKDMSGIDSYQRRERVEAAEVAMKMARSVKDPMRLVLNHVQFYKGIELKTAKAKGESPDPLEGVSDEQVKQLAAVIRGEAVVIPSAPKEAEAKVIADD